MRTITSSAPLIVISMHRTGSSFAASLLHRAGIDMGSRLMPPGHDNPLGFFENLDFVEFHEKWLRLSGYDSEGWLTPHRLDLPEDAYAEATELIAHNGASNAWGWKDPRTTLFADFWRRIVPNARYILLYREPSEVIASLLRRRDRAIVENPELAGRSWLAHNATILTLSRIARARSVVANVKVVCREPKRFLEIVRERFCITLDTDVASTFDPQLMTSTDSFNERSILLRYLVPECDHVFLELEAEADLAAGVHRGGAVTARRARSAFFSGWLHENDRRPLDDRAAGTSSVPSNPQSLSDAKAHLASANTALARHRAAVSRFRSKVNEG